MAMLRLFTLVFLFVIRCKFPKSNPLSEIIHYRYGNYVLKFIRKCNSSCFTLIGSTSNNFYLKLKEPLLILKLKQSFNVAKESMPLYLFNNDA